MLHVRKLKKPVKEAVKRYYGQKCFCCECKKKLQIHHVVPKYIGGTNYFWNLKPLCDEDHKAVHKILIRVEKPDPEFCFFVVELIKEERMR